MSNHNELYDQLFEMFSQKLHLEVLSPQTDLLEQGILDSLAFVSMLVCLEDEFHAEIPLESLEFDNFRSIEKIAEFVSNFNGEKEPARRGETFAEPEKDP